MKRKFNLWLNIVTICLCLCAVAVGVYSATTANLNVGGKVGFTAHGCDVDVSATIVGHAVNESGTDDPDGNPKTEPVSLGSTLEIRSNTQTLDIGSRYFSDMASDDGSAEDIVITFTVTNKSAFKITATFNADSITKPADVTVTADKTSADLDKDASTTFAITLHLEASTDGSYTTIPMPDTNNLSMSFAFAKWSQFKIDPTTKMLTTTMGHGIESIDGTTDAIEWIAFAVKGENLGNSYSITDETTGDTWYSLNGVDMTNIDYTGKTFWFIQKYVVAGGYIDSNNSWIKGQTFDDSNNDYDTSDICTYLNGTYLTATGISSSDLYTNSITTRSVSETYTVYSASQTCTFDSKLWLISQAELGLLNGSVAELYETYDSIPVKAYGIGNTAGDANGDGADWWLRSPCSDYFNLALCVYYDDGAFLGQTVGNTYGVRAAFEISIA